jgi:hypothetical protein
MQFDPLIRRFGLGISSLSYALTPADTAQVGRGWAEIFQCRPSPLALASAQQPRRRESARD